MKHEIHYIATALELRGPIDLASLADALTHRGLGVYHGGPAQDGLWFAQVDAAHDFPELNQDIDAMLTAIEALDEPVQRLWSACTIREFNIGYDCGDTPRGCGFNQELLPATLTRIAQLGASLVITIYPILETDAVEAAIGILKKDNWIRRHRGKANGYGIHHTDSSSLKKNQEEVKVTFYGKKGSVFVHCLMELTSEGEWGLKEILKKEERFYSCPT